MEATQCKCDPYWLHGWPDFSTLTSRSAHEKIFFSNPPSSCWAHFPSRCGRRLGDARIYFFSFLFNNAHLRIECVRVLPTPSSRRTRPTVVGPAARRRAGAGSCAKAAARPKKNAVCARAHQSAERARVVHPSAVWVGGETRGAASERDKLGKSGQPFFLF